MKIRRVSDASATEQEPANTPTAPEHTNAHVRDADARLPSRQPSVWTPARRERTRAEARAGLTSHREGALLLARTASLDRVRKRLVLGRLGLLVV